MEFAGTNYSAVGIAAVAGYAFGGAWYMVLSKPWIAATGRTEAEIKASFSPVVYIVAFIAQLVMAIFLAGAMGHVGTHWLGVLLIEGLIIGWIGV